MVLGKAISLAALLGLAGAASPYSSYILAPSSRTLVPASVHNVNGTIKNANALTTSGSGESQMSAGSAVTYDYGKNIGGLASFFVSALPSSSHMVGLSFSESNMWISSYASDATKDSGLDEILWFNVTKPGNYSVEPLHVSGTSTCITAATALVVSLSKLRTYFNAMPARAESDLRSYTGYFHANDEKLNKVWYAGAYNDQLCIIPSSLGNSLQDVAANAQGTNQWFSNSTLSFSPPVLVDGAKRDRLIWPGDYAHSVPGVLLTTNDVTTLTASFNQILSQQFSNGALPYFTKPLYYSPEVGIATLQSLAVSFDYNLNSIIVMSQYYSYSGDIAFVLLNYGRIRNAVGFALGYRDPSGMVDVSSLLPLTWARSSYSGHNIEANALLVLALKRAAIFANAAGDSVTAILWLGFANSISDSVNKYLWNDEAGFYRNNETSTLYPQDGNSLAIIAGVANATQASTISKNLKSRWGQYGAPSPKLPGAVSPYISGHELQAHCLAGNCQAAIDLMRLMWHDFMLEDPRTTQSTFLEGYSFNGSIHYPAYANDARVSHAHGWSTGPIFALTNFVAGINVITPKTWVIYPQVGDLTSIDTGFTVGSGTYSLQYTTTSSGSKFSFSTPSGSTGTVILPIPACNAKMSIIPSGSSTYSFTKKVSGFTGLRSGSISSFGPSYVGSNNGTIYALNVPGGLYTATIQCT
ncbi:Six-hairpin glycosidase [Aureobasidium pullulans]|uniref:Six-hairpin glycosidase n=1 Tax=Aureobasidium pullulans TaxID=5580 RepID=A0A4T0B2P7_AURPU|nr:Six-hairpin glycosidase [Aureobasidium pullulans]